jgi:tetratricopeptide (TPR) repeat protein
MTSVGQPSTRQFLQIALASAFVLGVAVAWYLLSTTQRPVATPSQLPARADPRISYEGPYRNIHPDVGAVGSAKCAVCHSEIAKVYAKHPMGMSILQITDQPIGDLANHAHTSFPAFGSLFRLDHAGDHLWYTETRAGKKGESLYELKADINYVIGSGNKGHSFLSERDGFVTQAAVSWYTQKHIWDESPGFPPELHFGRPIQVECLYCHANQVVPVGGATNRYEQPLFRNGHAIGCERCHGPGAEHVRLREGNLPMGTPDYSIVNPKHLEFSLREAVCQQCHLTGETRVVKMGRNLSDFRPGLALDAVMHVLVRDHKGEDRKAVNHVEQMYLSKCYKASGGALGCITCHDPHEKAPIEKRAQRYRTACLKCHDCSSPAEARAKVGAPDNCIACHMPQFAASDIVHAATTDHRIVRTREQSKSGSTPPKVGTQPLAFFPSRRPDFNDATEGRDYAVGLVEMAKQGKASGVEIAREALPHLERAIAENPDDYQAWEAKSYSLQYSGRKSEAFAAAQRVLSLLPNYESGLTHAAMLASEVEQIDQSLKHWRKAVALNPGNAEYRQELANLLARSGDWAGARVEAEEAVRLDPARATAHAILAIAQLRAGNRTKADELFQTVELLAPPNLNQLRLRYNAERGRP